jgi:hypothetical protein
VEPLDVVWVLVLYFVLNDVPYRQSLLYFQDSVTEFGTKNDECSKAIYKYNRSGRENKVWNLKYPQGWELKCERRRTV